MLDTLPHCHRRQAGPRASPLRRAAVLALEILSRSGPASIEPAADEIVAAPAPSGASDPAPEIEGEWQMTACNADGYAVPEQMVKSGRRIARNGETSSTSANRES